MNSSNFLELTKEENDTLHGFRMNDDNHSEVTPLELNTNELSILLNYLGTEFDMIDRNEFSFNDIDYEVPRFECDQEGKESLITVNNQSQNQNNIQYQNSIQKHNYNLHHIHMPRYNYKKITPVRLNPKGAEENYVAITVKGKYLCKRCPKAFKGTAALINHFKCVHSGKLNCSCHKCGKRFGSSNKLTSHKNVCFQ